MIKSNNLRCLLLLLLTTIIYPPVFAQDIAGYSKQEVKDLSKKVEDQILFLEYFLNTVGSKDTPARDKDVIIRESYSKIFRDGKVQVEDDLLLDRQVITNKDITSYLKDIEFFFKDASFKFKVREVKPFERDNGELSFLVSLDRTLTAVGLNKEKISNTRPRFVEINVDKNSNEIKIASVYTTRLSRDKELAEWWAALPFEWEVYFREKFDLYSDSLSSDQLYKIANLDSLIIRDNPLITSLAPISVLRELKYIDMSRTEIEDLGPISNVTYLEYLDVSGAQVRDLQFLKYSDRLKALNISDTRVDDISELGNLKNLEVLRAERTPVVSFSVLNSFTALRKLYLRESGFNNFEHIQELKNLEILDAGKNFLINFDLIANLSGLQELDLRETNLVDLDPLRDLNKLRILILNQTDVASLDPISGKSSLQRVYADRTRIPEREADSFVRKNRRVLLIHNVENLQNWWAELPSSWRSVLAERYEGLHSDMPSVERLSSLVGMDSLNLSQSSLSVLGPITRFKKLNYLDISGTQVEDLNPVAQLGTLTHLIANDTEVRSIQMLISLVNLEHLELNRTAVRNINFLSRLEKLKRIEADGTEVRAEETPTFYLERPDVELIYRTEELTAWYESLSAEWRGLLFQGDAVHELPSNTHLHKITAQHKLQIERTRVEDLAPLEVFNNLRSLHVFDAPLYDLSHLQHFTLLEELQLSQVPLQDLSPLLSLNRLKALDLSNTGISDLRELTAFPQLEKLNISGTNVKNLRGVESLLELQEIDLANTTVRSIKQLEKLPELTSVICFNTKINSRVIDKFKSANPQITVRFF